MKSFTVLLSCSILLIIQCQKIKALYSSSLHNDSFTSDGEIDRGIIKQNQHGEVARLNENLTTDGLSYIPFLTSNNKKINAREDFGQTQLNYIPQSAKPALTFSTNSKVLAPLGLRTKYDTPLYVHHSSSKENGTTGTCKTISTIDYPLNSTMYKKVPISQGTTIEVEITSVERKFSDFLIVQVHSQVYNVVLSFDEEPQQHKYVNATNSGLVVFMNHFNSSNFSNPKVYIKNDNRQDLCVLLLIRNYTNEEPVPGGLYNPNKTYSIPHPYLFLNQNIITTWVSFPLASFPDSLHSVTRPPYASSSTSSPVLVRTYSETQASVIKYEVFLTYMYEGDLHEEHFWQSLIETSTIEGLKKHAKKVNEIYAPIDSYWIHQLFVSYSGVGTVVNVLASFNDSKGVLYSASVFYGCDFILENNCTKLISPLAKLFCAFLLFIALVLLFTGHRWLNFTMYFSGFFFTWFLLFVIFVQIPNANIQALGSCTLIGAFAGGFLWLFLWHKFHRPFYSALLIILMSSFFMAMTSTHFLKYAFVPTRNNIAAFVVFPIAFSVSIIAYSLFNIKKVHIFSCCLLGSYGVVVPFAFYFGSSLTYIVINVISVMTIPRFTETVGYPPFQYCDITLLCVWISLFLVGCGYQLYIERLSPPFHPPNLSSFKALLSAISIVKEKTSLCLCGERSDDDSLFEERLGISSCVASMCPCFGCLSSGERNVEVLSNYESFPRIGSDDEETSLIERLASPFRYSYVSLRGTLSRMRQRMRRGEYLVEDPSNEDGGDQRRERRPTQDFRDADIEGEVPCCTTDKPNSETAEDTTEGR